MGIALDGFEGLKDGCEGQRDTKNTALISSVRILSDYKLRVISIGDRPPWNSIGVSPSKLLLKGY
ncbi:hypothetical protein BHE74_00032871 [Ensete ventricosum]|nr:hypothetical protein GW17_00022303 [Ensete ventricosum]RWW60151.1 hypothetical protein BHE74_00032871 [Ensete ventricosum]